MKKRILAVLLTLIMLFGMVPVSALAADSTDVYTNGTDGSNWPANGAYVNTVTLSGATVSSYSWAGDICNVILASDTPSDAAITFKVNMMGQRPLVLQSAVSIDGESSTNHNRTVTLSGGKKTVPVSVSMRGSEATKTFQLEVAGGGVVNTAPTLAEGVAGTATAERYVGSSFELDLTKVFTDAEDTALSYTVKIGNAAAVEAAASYSYTPTTAGTYTLVFTASDGKNSSPSHTVTLTVKDTALSLDKAEAEVDLGSTLTLTATTTPADGAVVWTSSAESVATVANGVVTPVAAGTATITATFGGKTASCVVTVNDPNELKANVILTLNDAGTLALIHEPVKVVDTDNDGALTYHDALVVVHDTYGKAYVAEESSYDLFVTTIWDKNIGGSGFFFLNGAPIPASVSATAVSEGSQLYTAILQDSTGWSDWYTSFDRSYATVYTGEELTLALTGYSAFGAMMGSAVPEPISGVSVGTVNGGEFDPISGKTTGADGKVTLSFDQPGTYIVSASGTANDNPLMPPVCIVTVTAVEVDGISLNKSELTLKLNKSETLTATVTPDNAANKSVTWTSSDPTVATVNTVGKVTALKVGTTTITAKTVNNKTATCAVTVEPADPAADAQVTMSIGMRGVLALTNAPVTVKDLNSDGMLTYDEALVAAHKAYCPSGIDGLTLAPSGWIIKLWGTETANLLFFRNNVPLTRFTNDKTSVVKAGDSLYAAVLMYETAYKDYYSCFDKTQLTVKAGEEFTLTLTGYPAATTGNNPSFSAVSGVSVGTCTNGAFTPITGKTTDTDGKVTLSFAQPGTYVVSAFSDATTAPLIAPFCTVTVEAAAPATGPLSVLRFTAGGSATAAEHSMIPAFSPGVREYTVVVPDNSTQFFAWATLSADMPSSSKIAIDYTKTSNTPYSQKITSGNSKGQSIGTFLKTGFVGNSLVVTVGGEAEYTVNVVRKAQLSNLELANGTTPANLTPVFSGTTTAYETAVAWDSDLTVTTTGAYSGSTVTINGQSVEVVKNNNDRKYYGTLTFKPQWNSDLQSEVSVVIGGSNGAVSTEYIVTLSQLATAIKIETPPRKTTYQPGETFDPTGMTLTAIYSDGTTKTITPENFTYPTEALGSGATSVSIVYDGLTVSQTISTGAAFEGDGTEDVPYLLKTADDLVKLSELVAAGTNFAGKHFKMVDSIELPSGWNPIGSGLDARFSGSFDGGSNTLTVPAGGFPLFGYVGGAVIKNLTVSGTQINGYGLINHFIELDETAEYMGVTIDSVTLQSGTSTLKSGLLGSYITTNGYGGSTRFSKAHISNCVIESGVVIGYDKDQSDIGAIAGRMQGSIVNCTSNATVYGVDYVGGLVGCQDNALGEFSISNSRFGGSVVATGSHAGGILGGGYDQSSGPNGNKPSIIGCSVTGSVTGLDKVGGILGGDTYAVSTWAQNSIKDNSFTGSVTATGGSYVGGIIGYYVGLNVNDGISNNYYTNAGTGIGFVKYVDTDCTTHETESGAWYYSTKDNTNLPNVTGCWWNDPYSRTDDPLGADKAKLCYTDSDVAPVATELKVSGTYKTEYETGDELDLTGIVLTVHYNKGEPKTIELKDVTVSGYDKETVGSQTLTLSYEGLTAQITVTVKANGKIKVTVSVLGDSIHNSDADGNTHTLAGGNLTTWAGAAVYEIDANATVYDALKLAFAANGITHTYTTKDGTVYIDSATKNGATLAEFINGNYSGWMYIINGYHSSQGVDQQHMKDGDVIVMHYTDNYLLENYGGAFEDDNAVANVKKLISQIGTPVTLESKAKVEAARKAYDELSYAQRAKVDNYATLTAAEDAIAKLQAEKDQKDADAVEELIKKIGTPITDYEKEVEAARAAYNALNDNAKKLVENYNKLLQAEKDLATAEDKEKADKVEKLIEAIGKDITVDSEKKITDARKAYDKLTDIQKALVENYKKLTDAETKLARVKLLKEYEDIHKATGDYMEKLDTPICGETGGEWMVLGLLRSGRELENRDEYYRSIVKFVEENIDENGRLHHAKSTENSRLVLALTAMGLDVTNVGGHNLLRGLSDMTFLQKQGINGPVWALIALDSGNYEIPAGDVSREAIIELLLDKQLDDGGWALSGEISDADITGMTLQALAPYYADTLPETKAVTEKIGKERTEAVKKAVDEALNTLSAMQNPDGGYGTFGAAATCESSAQVLTALCALGIDPTVDARFIKNGKSVLDAISEYAVKGGGFRHLLTGDRDGMATEQGYYALTAFFRLINGKTGLYDMSDVTKKAAPATPVEASTMAAFVGTSETVKVAAPMVPVENDTHQAGDILLWVVVAAAIAVAIAAGALFVIDHKKYHGKH